MESEKYWRDVYVGRAADAVSWYQKVPEPSLATLDRFGMPPSTPLIDVGAGASTLVDELIGRGWSDLTILDISEPAIAATKARLGTAAARVGWEIGDITRWRPARSFEVWHDRALFHFLTGPQERAAYRAALERALVPGGLLIIATFALDGPDSCSGLPVRRYDSHSLAAELGEGFRLGESWRETHNTPRGASQSFNWCTFERG